MEHTVLDDNVTDDQRERFDYLHSLIAHVNEGSNIDTLRRRYGTTMEPTPTADVLASRTGTPLCDVENTGDVFSNLPQAKPSQQRTLHKSKRIKKSLQRKKGIFERFCSKWDSAVDAEKDEEWVAYADDSIWCDETRGIAPIRAKIMLVQRYWKDEFYSAIRGVQNTATHEVVGGIDPDNVNVAPNIDDIDPYDPRMNLYSRSHMYGHAVTKKAREMERAAFVVIENIYLRAKREQSFLKSYQKLAGYLLSMLLLFSVISLQWNMGNANQRLFAVISDQIFANQGQAAWVATNEATAKASTGFSKDDIFSWLSSNVLGKVFIPNICGDNECSAPDEYPYFHGHPEMRLFQGCESDCGRIPTRKVKVNFFDPWKLQAAYDQVENAVRDGWNGGNGLLEAQTYKGYDTKPVAGWNVCNQHLKEQGFFETVCLFDGDIFIDGLPYRTAELQDGGDSFGGELSFELFDGSWELRIAFDGKLETEIWYYLFANLSCVKTSRLPPLRHPMIKMKIVCRFFMVAR
jgi:hypothetical protein